MLCLIGRTRAFVRSFNWYKQNRITASNMRKIYHFVKDARWHFTYRGLWRRLTRRGGWAGKPTADRRGVCVRGRYRTHHDESERQRHPTEKYTAVYINGKKNGNSQMHNINDGIWLNGFGPVSAWMRSKYVIFFLLCQQKKNCANSLCSSSCTDLFALCFKRRS